MLCGVWLLFSSLMTSLEQLGTCCKWPSVLALVMFTDYAISIGVWLLFCYSSFLENSVIPAVLENLFCCCMGLATSIVVLVFCCLVGAAVNGMLYMDRFWNPNKALPFSFPSPFQQVPWIKYNKTSHFCSIQTNDRNKNYIF